MPLLIPTPDDLQAMPWHKRQQARKKILTLLASYGPTPVDLTEDPASLTGEEWGEWVRQTAKAALTVQGPDPDAAHHRALLEEALK